MREGVRSPIQDHHERTDATPARIRRRGMPRGRSASVRACRGWCLVWLGPAAIATLHFTITGRFDALHWAALFVAAAAYSLAATLVPTRAIKGVLAVWLTILVAGSIAAPLALGWVPDDGEDLALANIVRRAVVGLEGRGQWSFAVGQTGAADEVVTVSFEASAEPVSLDTGWLRSHVDYRTTTEHDALGPYTRVVTPEAEGAYLRKVFPTDAPVGGSTFRLTWSFRSLLEFEPGTCRGVVLHAGLREVGRAGVSCQAVRPSVDWERYDIVWHPPESITDTRVNVDLREMEGIPFDIRGVALYRLEPAGWRALGPSIPDVPYASVAYVSESGREFQIGLTPLAVAPRQLPHELRALVPADASRLIVRAHVGSHGSEDARSLTMSNVRAERADGERLRSLHPGDVTTRRQRLLSPHPNLAGHSAAVLGVGLAATALTAKGGLLAVPAALTVIWATGSRAALLGATLGWLLWLVTAPSVRHSRRGVLVALALFATTVVALGWFGSLGRLQSFDEGTELVRTGIWSTAWEALRASPSVGSTPAQRSSLFDAAVAIPGATTVGHAHNLWLEFGSLYGLLGLAAAGWLSVALTWRAWAWGRWAGVALLVPLAIGQVIDYTVFYVGVLLPTIAWLEVMRRDRETQEAMPGIGPDPLARRESEAVG